MTKEELLAIGVTEEQIPQIFAINGKDIEGVKANLITKETELKDIQEQLITANSTIDELKKSTTDNETLQNKIAEYETTINELKTTSDITKKEFTLKDRLKDIGVKDADYLIYKHGGVDKFSFDQDGKLIGLEETITPYKETIPHLFATGEIKKQYDPNGGEGFKGSNPFAKETYNLTEQGKLFKNNPAQAKELADAAGVKI